MPARVVELAEAVAAYVAATAYSFTINVERKVPIKSDLRDTARTYVFVYPNWATGKALPVDTRDAFGKQYSVFVHITDYIDDINAQHEIDDALLLAEEIEASLENVEMAGFSMLNFGGEAETPFLEIEQINERNFFHVAIPVTYVTVD